MTARDSVAPEHRRNPRWLHLSPTARNWLRWLVGLALAALVFYALAGRTGELSGASRYLVDVKWGWLVPAVVVEAASYVAFAAASQWLLRAGGLRVGLRTMTNITVVATTITNSLPAGPLVATVFQYRQYRRRGADDVLSAWALAGMLVAASVSLAVFAAGGVALAGAGGTSFDLLVPIVTVLAITVVIGALFIHQRSMVWLLERFRRLLNGRERSWARLGASQLERVATRLTAFRLSPTEAVAVLVFSLANWVLDCACLACSFRALGVGIPWKGLGLAYGAGQLAVNLPVTPGGLGVVEGSLTIALVAFGGSKVATVAVVLLYRILSFWLELPVGWTLWGWLAWRTRRAPVPASEVVVDLAREGS